MTFEKYVYRFLIVLRKIHEEYVWKFLELFKNILEKICLEVSKRIK